MIQFADVKTISFQKRKVKYKAVQINIFGAGVSETDKVTRLIIPIKMNDTPITEGEVKDLYDNIDITFDWVYPTTREFIIREVKKILKN
jgi:hypothetical protein